MAALESSNSTIEVTRVYRREKVPAADRHQKLPLCDAYAPKIWAKQAYFYRLKDGQSIDRIREIVCEGCRRLQSDYTRCGAYNRLGNTGDHRDNYIDIENGYIEVQYEDLTTRSDIPSYEELEKTNVAIPFELGLILIPRVGFRPVKADDIQMVVKISRLQGAMCLGVAYNHSLGDGGNLVDIERTWSMHCADASAGRPQAKHYTYDNKPEHIAWLSTPGEGIPDCDDPNFSFFPTAATQLNLPLETTSTDDAITNLRESRLEAMEDGDDVRWCIWYFSPATLRQLRKDASAVDAPQPTSQVAALAGLFWSRICAVKKVSAEDDDATESKLFFPINVRHRVRPALPLTFVGNVQDIIPAIVPLEKLETESDKEGAIREAAKAFRAAIAAWSQTRFQSWIKTAAELDRDTALCPNPLLALQAQNVIFNDYSRAPTFYTDWGSDIGKVDRVRYPRPAGGPATAVRIHPLLPDGGLEVAASGTDEFLMKLSKDEVFTRYAQLSCYPA